MIDSRTNTTEIKAVQGISNFDEAINTFGINFNVDRVPHYTNVNGILRNIPQNECIVRTDNYNTIGIVGNNYPIISPRDKFKVFESFAQEGIIEFVKGGTFGKYGGKVFLQARIKGSLNLTAQKGEIVEKRITFISSYDGGKSNELFITPYRLVCSNGMVIPEKALTKFKVRNSTNCFDAIQNAVVVIEEAINEYREIDVFFNTLMESKPLGEKQVERFVDLVLPSPTEKISTRTANRRTSMIETIFSGVGQKEIKTMNLWKLLQGATSFSNNVEGSKKKDHFEYVYFGTGNNINQTAYNVVSEALIDDAILN